MLFRPLRVGPVVVCCAWVPGCAFLPRRAGLLGVPAAALRASCCLLCPGSGLCVPASSGRAAWCARLLDVSVAVLQACCCFACGGLLVSSVVPLCTDQSCPPVTNVARNSPPHISDFEIRPLELQRLWAISKNDRVELRAKLIWRSPRFPPRAPWPGPSPPTLAAPVAMGVLHH